MGLIMMRIIRIALYFLLILCFSCEDKGWFAKCDECTEGEPETAILEIKLTNSGMPVALKIYEGLLEDSILYQSVNVPSDEYNTVIKVNNPYTITATYSINGDTYIAVDAVTAKVRYIEDQCDGPCYFVYDKVVNLRLKYTASGK